MSHKLSRPRSLLPRFAVSGLAALGLLTTLGGCGDEESASVSFAPSCPLTHIPPEAADYYLYDGKTATFPHLVTRASILKLQGDCLAAGPKDLKTRIALRFVVNRGPAATSSTVTLPWFVAVLHGDKIVNKHVFRHTFEFPANLSSISTDTKVITVDLPIPPKNTESDYRFEVGFQLTKDQLDYNETHLKKVDYHAY
ncbi:hypothetical protein OQ252_06660 [Acetobacter farinalis]|uniref:Lipoprotein n=1 Tax=Acetobacter farinalis TaxID=1260984 RepID=A0ABT3Q712_9PROT|nr:hypothetical protein [Acetobacter farinalis]MCX2561079.1 hypothetical protein [Acetobacter farinalis]NHO29671.1 hypothetical protein [Acetobacter farinalis]